MIDSRTPSLSLGTTPGTITAVSLLSMGALVLTGGLVGLIRHAQRHRNP